jgi:hypothetical protein
LSSINRAPPPVRGASILEGHAMNDREFRRYAMFGRVETFGKTNAADFAAASEALARFANITQIIQGLDVAKANQQGGGITAKAVMLDSLRLDLTNIIRTARAIAQDEPGFADNFRPPDGTRQAALLTAADAMLADLQKSGVAAKFIAHELPADFVQQLTDDRQAIAAAQDAQENTATNGVASTATIDRLIRDGIKHVTYLDAIMFNKYTRVPEKLRAWHSASTTERAPRAAKKAANTAGAPATPAAPAK